MDKILDEREVLANKLIKEGVNPKDARMFAVDFGSQLSCFDEETLKEDYNINIDGLKVVKMIKESGFDIDTGEE
jgi:hypothetical protein